MIIELKQKDIGTIFGGASGEVSVGGDRGRAGMSELCCCMAFLGIVALLLPAEFRQAALCRFNCDHWREEGWEFKEDCEKSTALIRKHCTDASFDVGP